MLSSFSRKVTWLILGQLVLQGRMHKMFFLHGHKLWWETPVGKSFVKVCNHDSSRWSNCNRDSLKFVQVPFFDCKLEWIWILQVCKFSFFPFFLAVLEIAILWTLFPSLCKSVSSFVGFVFFVSLTHTQWNGVCFQAFVFLLQSPVTSCGEYGSGFLLFLTDFVLEVPRSSHFRSFRDFPKLLASDNYLTFICSSNAIQ